MRFKGKTAIITGGSGGIGKAIGIRLAREGANIAVLDVNAEAGSATVKEIEALGVRATAYECNVVDYEQTKSQATRVHDDFGTIDILINNAGIDKSQLFTETDVALWDRLIDVNYKGFLVTTHIFLPFMVAQKSGVVVSMGSAAGRVGTTGAVVYSGTKAAIMASSKSLAREMARYNIRFNCVAPGPVQTSLLAGLHDGEKGQKIMDSVAKMIPMRRIGEPEDVADVVAFLASDDARYLTGQVISVDGGLTMIG